MNDKLKLNGDCISGNGYRVFTVEISLAALSLLWIKAVLNCQPIQPPLNDWIESRLWLILLGLNHAKVSD